MYDIHRSYCKTIAFCTDVLGSGSRTKYVFRTKYVLGSGGRTKYTVRLRTCRSIQIYVVWRSFVEDSSDDDKSLKVGLQS